MTNPFEHGIDLDSLAPLGRGRENAAEWLEEFSRHGARYDEWFGRRTEFEINGETWRLLPDPLLREAEPWVEQATCRFHVAEPNLLMLIDLARNDVARVSVAGTTEVVQQLAIEKYSHVQHLVSRVQGRLREDLDALHAYRAAANMGTLTGAPKLRAMELIREVEPCARGFYGGAAGYLLQDGSFDSCIVIRSLRYKDGVYHTRAGAGIVWDSDPESELAETEQKSLAVREAVASAEEASR